MDVNTLVRIVATAAFVVPIVVAAAIEGRIARRREEWDRHCETAVRVSE